MSASNKQDDSHSLWPVIDKELYNTDFDVTAVMSEWDFREPIKAKILTQRLDDKPNFMIRRWNVKLLIKKASSTKAGVLFNLDDPFETSD